MNRIPVLVFGAGGVGRALLQQIVASRASTEARANCHFDVVAVVDSQSWAWNPQGFEDQDLRGLIAAKNEARRSSGGRAARRGPRQPVEPPLGEERPHGEAIIQQAVDASLEGSIVVDASATDDVITALDRAIQAGYGLVLANKIPLAGPWEEARRFYDRPQIRYEATVGGGQPVIATLRNLLDSGDRLERIEGQLSGTLAHILQRLDDGKTAFSVALAGARAGGLTEPDPRQDLGGRDVQRKLLILGRTAGWPLEQEAIAAESLYPSSLAHLDVQEFMMATVALDPSMRDRMNAAGAAGETLRYLAQLQAGGGQVGLRAVPRDAPQANLKYVSFQTEHYAQSPLLVGSNSGGVQTTAAAVLGDMVSLVREWESW